jgi:hypothetical protein
MMGQEQPAKDTQEVTWIGKDHMRVEEGDKVTIVRLDLKKMYILDTKAKTSSTLDLPVDMDKYMPEEMAPMMEQMLSQMKVTITPTEEKKKIQDWNATKYTMTMSLPMGGSLDQEMWVVKDIGIDPELWQKLQGAVMSVERTQKMMGNEMKSTEKVLSVEEKDPPKDFYDLPKDYKDTPYDPMSEMHMGGSGGAHGPRGG